MKRKKNIESKVPDKKVRKGKEEQKRDEQQISQSNLVDQTRNFKNFESKLKKMNFQNRSNKCFLNASTTSLLNCKSIVDILKNNSNDEQNSIKNELNHILNLNEYSNYCTEPLTKEVTRYYRATGQNLYFKIFDDGHQKDAAEFLQTLIEYCRCGEMEDLAAEGMSEVFQLPIVGSSLNSCLRSFVEPEEIEKRCRKEDCNFQKKMQVLNFLKKPQVLIIQLKRFSYVLKEGRQKKFMCHC